MRFHISILCCIADTISDIIAAEVQNSTVFHTPLILSAELGITGNYNLGQLQHANTLI